MMLSGSMDETLRLWDLSALGQSGCDRQSAILSLGFPPRSSALVVGLENGAVEVRDHWDRPGRRVGSHAEGVRALAILGDGRSVLTACSGGGVRISDLSGGEERILIPCHTRSISRISILDEHRVVLLGGHGGLEILDLRTGVVTATQPAHPSGIASGAVLPDGAVVTGGHDGVICLWDPETGEVIKRMTSPDEVGPINAIVPRRGGSQLVAVTGNGWIYVWDLVGNIPISIQGGEAFARNPRRGFQLAHGFLDACMLHDAPILALCCGDKTVRLWDLTRGEATRRFADDHLAAACVFDAVLGRLVVANQHGRLQVFDLSNIAFSD
jgi:WD40 repeat protein